MMPYGRAKASTVQPTGLPVIPQPEKGVVGNGFNLHTAMELDNDHTLYCTVCVSLKSYTFILLSTHTQHCIHNLAERARLDCTIPWHGQPKETIGKIIGAVSPSLFFSLFIQDCMF